jgi:ABC-type transport system substrate-binding protein
MSYWSKVVQSRISRRRALAATSAGALSAAFLAACGSDDDGGSSSGGKDSSGLIASPEDTTSQAKTGGTIKDFYTAELTDMDALRWNTASTVNLISVFAYPRMLKFTIVKAPETNDGSMVEGETAASYEVSPDKLTVTMKLRQGMKWDSRAPTNGRVIDTDDVLFSWKKFSEVNASGVNLANSRAQQSRA